MTLLGFKTILHEKNVGLAKIQKKSRKFLGAPMSSKMKTNFKKSVSCQFLLYYKLKWTQILTAATWQWVV